MTELHKRKYVLLAVVCFGLGYLAATVQPQSSADPTPPAKVAPPLPMEARLASNLYQQTAAEYRACCLTIYQSAGLRLEAMLQTTKPRPARPAVVMDLDETVLDNSKFQSFLYKYRLEYTDALWDLYEERYPKEVALVPGAAEFIARAQSLGVKVVYISNRSERFRSSTIASLRAVGLDTTDIESRLLLKEQDASSDKSSRRDWVSARFNVLMYFGDNLRDFAETFAARKLTKADDLDVWRAAIRERDAAVDAARVHWGIDWFVLPNPVYGEWEKLLGDEPKARLRPTEMVRP